MTKDDALGFHCPRWEELPSISLYMDQVVIVVEEALGIFADEKERVVTSTMINNYVKQKLISPPVKKRYERRHIAFIIVVSVLKKVLSMQEIMGVMELMLKQYGMDAAYNMYCESLEAILAAAFSKKSDAKTGGEEKPEVDVMNASIHAVTEKLYVQYFLSLKETETK